LGIIRGGLFTHLSGFTNLPGWCPAISGTENGIEVLNKCGEAVEDTARNCFNA